MLAARSLGNCYIIGNPRLTPCVSVSLAPSRLLVTTRATQDRDSKSWSEIGAEVVGVVKDVATKIKDTAASAVESLTAPKQKTRQDQDRGGPLYKQPEEDRQLPQFPSPGGVFGGIMGGLVNQAVKGLAQQLEKAAAETRSVSDEAAMRIQQDTRIQQRLGRVTVGPAMSQAVSSQSINGKMTKTVNVVLPVLNAGGALVAQAQVTHTEGSGQRQSPRIVVRMPEGDTLLIDDNQPSGGSRGPGTSQQYGEVVDAEFKDIK